MLSSNNFILFIYFFIFFSLFFSFLKNVKILKNNNKKKETASKRGFTISGSFLLGSEVIDAHISTSCTQIFIVVRAASKRVLIVNSGLHELINLI